MSALDRRTDDVGEHRAHHAKLSLAPRFESADPDDHEYREQRRTWEVLYRSRRPDDRRRTRRAALVPSCERQERLQLSSAALRRQPGPHLVGRESRRWL